MILVHFPVYYFDIILECGYLIAVTIYKGNEPNQNELQRTLVVRFRCCCNLTQIFR